MKLNYNLALLAIFLLPVTHSHAQESFTVNLKKATKGSTAHVEMTDTETKTLKVADNAGQVIENKTDKQVKTSIFDETILERPDVSKKATAVKRNYQKATLQVDNDTSVLPYQGKTVFIEKKDGSYHFRYENGGEIIGKDAELLEEEFNKDASDVDLDALLLPTKAVALNEEWKVSMPEFLKALEKGAKITIHADKAKGSGKLVKVYKKDGRQYGDMVISLDLPLKSMHPEIGDIIFQPGSALKMELKQTACIDGSFDDAQAKWTMEFDGSALFPEDNPMARIEVIIRNTTQGSATEVLKK